MYERDLQDLIRGLRSDAAKRNEEKFIAGIIDEIRKEITAEDMHIKGGAICKLTYLDILGYDMSWASFHVVEVMSSSHVHIKAGGYLAAIQSFNQDTDVLMLTTNLIKKDLSSGSLAEVSLSLDCLSQIATPSLSRDIAQDLVPMLNHSRPGIRKRAILAMFKIVQQYPQALEANLSRLCEKLQDPDIGVASATINLFCELARQDPHRFLPLAPFLFGLLTSASNNWMLIKIVKLFGALAPFEPRLVKKLQPPLTDLISTTPAISLLYECVHTCIIGNLFQGHNGYTLARTCVNKLASFLLDPDQNLKYIALLSLAKIVPTYPQLVAEHQQNILKSTGDIDISIRVRALDLVTIMVSRDTLQQVVQHLLSHLDSQVSLPNADASLSLNSYAGNPEFEWSRHTSRSLLSSAYRSDVSKRVIDMCSRESYANVEDFEWYLSVLVDLSYVTLADVGREIGDELISVAVRVKAARRYAVNLMAKLLGDSSFYESNPGGGRSSCARVLWAAAWICGEFGGVVPDPLGVANIMLQPSVNILQPDIKAVFLHSATKLLGHWASGQMQNWTNDRLEAVKEEINVVLSKCHTFTIDVDIEVQERAALLSQLLNFIQADLNSSCLSRTNLSGSPEEPSFPKSLCLIQPLFRAYELGAIGPEAQAGVHTSLGIDLDLPILPENAGLLAANPIEKSGRKITKRKQTSRGQKPQKDIGVLDTLADNLSLENDREEQRLQRLLQIRNDPYYLVDHSETRDSDNTDSIPIVMLNDDIINRNVDDNRQKLSHQISEAEGWSALAHNPSGYISNNTSATPPPLGGTAAPQPVLVVRAKKGGKVKRKKPMLTTS